MTIVMIVVVCGHEQILAHAIDIGQRGATDSNMVAEAMRFVLDL